MLRSKSRLSILLLMLLTTITSVASTEKENHQQSSVVIQLFIKDVIGPATADYVERNLQKAAESQAMAVLIKMDTPGGLDLSMRQIIKQIIASPIPVITYVSPSGARAASAGTYILYASHIAAMAPATNLGAATPVQIGGFGGFNEDKANKDQDKQEQKPKNQPLSNPMSHKAINDAAAYIRGLAKMRNRNQEWAEQAVRIAASLSSAEALKLNVIDIVAVDETDLFRQIQNRKVKVLDKELILNTSQVQIKIIMPDWRSQFLSVITNPSIAYVLLMVGIYGLVFEFSNPGSIIPGTVGGICLILAMYALQLLPVNYAGVALIIFGVALMIAEAYVPSFGILGMGGIAAFVIGSVILIDTDIPGFGIDIGLIAGFGLSSLFFLIIAIGFLLKARKGKIVSGKEEMLGAIGVVTEDFSETGRIRVHSENWQATSSRPLHKNDRVRVVAIDGLQLQVKPAKQQEHTS